MIKMLWCGQSKAREPQSRYEVALETAGTIRYLKKMSTLFVE